MQNKNGKTISNGDPTEKAILDAGIENRINKLELEKDFPRIRWFTIWFIKKVNEYNT